MFRYTVDVNSSCHGKILEHFLVSKCITMFLPCPEKLKEVSHGVLGHCGRVLKLLFLKRKPENNSLLRYKNINEIIINHKGTRIVKDGED